MKMSDFIAPENVLVRLQVKDKPQLLTELSRRAAAPLLMDVRTILGALTAREELGSTGIGDGVAIPHARLEGLRTLFGLFAHLERPIDFAAIDDKPVDLVFLLLSPTGADSDHLAALASVSRRLRDRSLAERLRATHNPGALYDLLSGTSPPAKS
jgi:PTS system nitrogen regulatory IIA component